MGPPVDDDEQTKTESGPVHKPALALGGDALPTSVLGAAAPPTGVALGSDAAPTTVALGSDAAPTTVSLGSEAAATSVLPWPTSASQTSLPLPRDFELTGVLPWNTTEPGMPSPLPPGWLPPGSVELSALVTGPLSSSTDPGAAPAANPPPVEDPVPPSNPAPARNASSKSLTRGPTVPNNPALAAPPSDAPGFTALGTDIDPQQTAVQPQVSPVLIPRPKVSFPRRFVRSLTSDVRIVRANGKPGVLFFGLFGLLALGALIGAFQIVNWAISAPDTPPPAERVKSTATEPAAPAEPAEPADQADQLEELEDLVPPAKTPARRPSPTKKKKRR